MRLIRKDMKEGHLHNHKDIEIDIIQIENDKCSIVQCKNRPLYLCRSKQSDTLHDVSNHNLPV